MSRKIKFHAFQVLFRLFAYLADKSGGWKGFVRPKLLLGSLIVGLGLTLPKEIQAQTPRSTTNSPQTEAEITCYVILPVTQASSEKVYMHIEQMPQYPGGEAELTNYITKNLKYPQIAIDNEIQGKVVCLFVVTETGNIERIEVIRSLDPTCDKEALRVIKSFPKFIPGKLNGKNVSVWYTLPIAFKLQKKHHVTKN